MTVLTGAVGEPIHSRNLSMPGSLGRTPDRPHAAMRAQADESAPASQSFGCVPDALLLAESGGPGSTAGLTLPVHE
jgi:hypothetical protein